MITWSRIWRQSPGPVPGTAEQQCYLYSVHRYLDLEVMKEMSSLNFCTQISREHAELVVSCGWVAPAEAESYRELTQHGVLPFRAGREGRGNEDLNCDKRVLPLAWCTVPPALRALGKPSSCSCWYITKCTQNTDMSEITEGKGRHSMYSMTAPWPPPPF